MPPTHASPEAPRSGPEIDDALAKLSESDRAVLLMRFFQERSYREMAEVSGQNEAAIRKRVERALDRLAPHLGNGGATAAELSALSVSGSLQAALTHAAPQGFAAAAGAAAMAGAPALTISQVILHSIRIMTIGKSAFLFTAVLLALLTFGGSYAMSRQIIRSAEKAVASPAGDPAQATGTGPPAAGQRPGLAVASDASPGDSPARTALRERLRLIGKSMSVDLRKRSFNFSGGFGLPGGNLLRAMGDFEMADLPAAWRMLPDFHARPNEFNSIATFLTSLRLETESPRDVLQELLAPELRINGKPSDFAVHEALSKWFNQEPGAAFDWMLRAVSKGDFPFDRRIHYGSDLVERWLGSDPAAALAALDTLGPDWTPFRQAAMGKVLRDKEGQETLWPLLEKGDDRTVLLVSDSFLESSEWARDTVLPWLLTRPWADGTTPDRILHGWIWKDGELNEPGFGMLCQSGGELPAGAAHDAVLSSVRNVLAGVTPEARPAMLEQLVKDPARRESLEKALKH